MKLFFLAFFISISPCLSQEPSSFPTDLTVESFDGVKIHGTYLESNSDKLTIIVAGSGPTDRDGNNPLYKNNSLKMLAEALYEQDISSFRYDKRGIGASVKGVVSEDLLMFDDYINDLGSIINFFKKTAKYNQIIVIGHSEGSLISSIAFQKYSYDKFVSIAGTSVDILSTIRNQLLNQPEFIQNMTNPIIDKLQLGQTVDSVPPMLNSLFRASVQPFLINMASYEPIKQFSKINIPILIIQGTNDVQVSVQDAISLDNASPNSEMYIIEGMNHIFKQASSNRLENIKTYSDPTLEVNKDMVNKIVQFVRKE